jgi:hypothetical protein
MTLLKNLSGNSRGLAVISMLVMKHERNTAFYKVKLKRKNMIFKDALDL